MHHQKKFDMFVYFFPKGFSTYSCTWWWSDLMYNFAFYFLSLDISIPGLPTGNITFRREEYNIIYLTILLWDIEIISHFSLYNMMGILMRKSLCVWDHLVGLVATSSTFWTIWPDRFSREAAPTLGPVVLRLHGAEGIFSPWSHTWAELRAICSILLLNYKVRPHSYVNFNDSINTHTEKCAHCEPPPAFS